VGGPTLRYTSHGLNPEEGCLGRHDELSKESALQEYKKVYDEWMKTYQNAFGKFYPAASRRWSEHLTHNNNCRKSKVY